MAKGGAMIDVKINDTISWDDNRPPNGYSRPSSGADVIQVGVNSISYRLRSSGVVRTITFKRPEIKHKFRHKQLVVFLRYNTYTRITCVGDYGGVPAYGLDGVYSGIKEDELRGLTAEEIGQQ
jgi:hypothetical protein